MHVKCACIWCSNASKALTVQCRRTHLVSSVVSNHRPVATPLEKVLSRRLTVWGTVSSRTLMQKAARNSSSRVHAAFTSLRQGHKAVHTGVFESARVRCARCGILTALTWMLPKAVSQPADPRGQPAPSPVGSTGDKLRKPWRKQQRVLFNGLSIITTLCNTIRTCILLPAAAKNCWTNDTNSFCRLPARQYARGISI